MICSEVRTPGVDNWRERLEALAWEYRRVLEAHRDAAELLASTLPVGPNRLRLAEIGLATLIGAGFEPEVTARASRLFVDYVTNFVVEEGRAEAIASKFTADDDSDDSRSVRDWFEELPADQYPTLIALAGQLTDPDDDARFAFGLRTFLDGLSHQKV